MVSGISEIVLLFLSAPLAVFLPSFYRNCIFHICSIALAEIGRFGLTHLRCKGTTFF